VLHVVHRSLDLLRLAESDSGQMRDCRASVIAYLASTGLRSH